MGTMTDHEARRRLWRIRYLRARLAVLGAAAGGDWSPAEPEAARLLIVYLEARLQIALRAAPRGLVPAAPPLVAQPLPPEDVPGSNLEPEPEEEVFVAAALPPAGAPAPARAATPAAMGRARRETDDAPGFDRVALSAFAPTEARPGARVLIQAVIHTPMQAAAVRRAAQERDPKAKRRGATMLKGKLQGGDAVRVTLEAPGLKVKRPIQRFKWEGAPLEAFFEARVPAFKKIEDVIATLRVEANGAPVGRVSFTLLIDKNAPKRPEPAPAPEFRPYRYVFLSYAHEDRDKVLAQAQMLERLGVPFFQDIVSLRAGDRWAVTLEEEMAKADLLMLFWSKAAAKSHWVRQEAEWALSLQRRSPEALPEIRPVILEGPPPPKPPETLEEIHFNDPIRCIQAAYARR